MLKTTWKLLHILNTGLISLKDQKKLTSTHRYCLVLYQNVSERNEANRKAGKAEFHYTMDALAHDLGLKERRAKYIVRDLEKATLIAVDRSASQNGGRDKYAGNKVSLEPLWSLVEALKTGDNAKRNKQVVAIKKETGRITAKQKRIDTRNARIDTIQAKYPNIALNRQWVESLIKEERDLAKHYGTTPEWEVDKAVRSKLQKAEDAKKKAEEATDTKRPPAIAAQPVSTEVAREEFLRKYGPAKNDLPN